MRRPPLAALVLLLALLAGLAACEPRAGEDSPLPREDVAALEDLVESYRLAALAGEWEALADLYASEGVRNAPYAEPVEVGPDELEAAYRTLEEFENAPEDIDGRGDLAYVRGTYRVRLGGAPGDESGEASGGAPAGAADGDRGRAADVVEDTGDYLALMRKQGDGRWRIAYLMINSDRPPPEPAATPED